MTYERTQEAAQRLSVTVENIVDVPETNRVNYAVTIRAENTVLYTRPSVLHHSFSRWRQVFLVSGLQEADVVPDFTPFHQSKAIPEYLSTATNAPRSISGPKFDILDIGDLTYPMGSAGGRPSLARTLRGSLLMSRTSSRACATMC